MSVLIRTEPELVEADPEAEMVQIARWIDEGVDAAGARGRGDDRADRRRGA